MATKKKKNEMSFLDHLEELRWLIIRSIIAICVFAMVAFHFDTFIFNDILLAPKDADFITNRVFNRLAAIFHSVFHSNGIIIKPFQIINVNMSGQFQADMWISIIAGIIIAFPYIIWEIWRFIAPALYDKERRHARGAVWAISGLFLIGVLFGYYVIAPLSVHFLINYTISNQIVNMINLNSYFSTVASVTLASGLIFELPVLTFFLAKVGLLTAAFMRKYRRHAIIVILVVAAIIAPPDVFSMTLVAIPLYLLYEISIWLVSAIERKKNEIPDQAG